MSRRTTIQAALCSALNATTGSAPDFVTVKTVNNIDDKYPRDLTQAQLPAIKIYFTDETPDYNMGMYAMNKLSPDLYIYVIEWDKDSTSNEESILKLVRDKLGNNPTLSGACVDISLRNIIKLEMEYPLVCYKINFIIKYDESISNL